MNDEKAVLEKMTDMMAEAAHATKEVAKSAARKVKTTAKKMMPNRSVKKTKSSAGRMAVGKKKTAKKVAKKKTKSKR